MINPNIQHYLVWKSFNTKIYQKTLTSEHITNNGNKKHIGDVFKIIKDATGNVSVEECYVVNKNCLFIEKNGIKYILQEAWEDCFPLNVKEYYECYLKKSDTTIYRMITKPSSVKIGVEKNLPLKALINVWNNVEHSDMKTWTFLKIQAIASKAKGGKYRLCSPPASGKNANDIILHMIFNNNIRVSKPTLAKLETLLYYNQKVVPDEMTSLTTAQVKEIEGTILQIADESPVFEKHSKAQRKDMNEIDISSTSLIFTYNDKNSLGSDSKFFDDIWQNKQAFNSRYPALLLEGEVISQLRKINKAEAEDVMLTNFDKLRTIAKNIAYYVTNMKDEIKPYDTSLLNMKGRHKSNFQCVIDALTAYCDSQQELDEWMIWINDKVEAYKDMVEGPGHDYTNGRLV